MALNYSSDFTSQNNTSHNNTSHKIKWGDWPMKKGCWDALSLLWRSRCWIGWLFNWTWPHPIQSQGVSACRCGCGDHGPWDLRLCCAIPALGCHGVGRVDSGDSLWWWVGLAILSFHRLKLDLSELVLTLTLTVFPPHLAIQSCCHPFFGLLCRSSPTLGLSFGAMSLNLISALNVARILIFYTSFWYMILRIQNLFHLWAS